MAQQKTILVAPLNWGLGHATRLVPIIDALLRQQAEVILAADKRPYDFLKDRFPDCKIIRFPGFEPYYPEKIPMAFNIMFSFPDMLKKSRTAHKQLQEIIDRYAIDIVISDNRYELSSSKAYCVFITHQLNIQTFSWQRLFQPLIRKIVYSYIKKFDELWIPDYKNQENNLSGKLSHVKRFPINNYHFTGPLSRFKPDAGTAETERTDLLVILSGPEPQRSIFEQLITSQLLKSRFRATILQSKPEEKLSTQKENITLISHAGDRQTAALIKAADMVICRPGYSTIMDLSVFGKNIVFVPTPGQTEQIYLAREMKKKGIGHFEKQESFNLQRAMETANKYTGLPQIPENNKVDKLIRRLLFV